MKQNIVPPKSLSQEEVHIEPIFVRAKMRISACIFFINLMFVICFPCLQWFLYGEFHHSIFNIILAVIGIISFLLVLLFLIIEKPRKITRKYLKYFLNDNEPSPKIH